ncbi:OmpA family protein [Saccharicrinis sp. FJH54]|uniref:OmpA family protein n=1 Tax=Saccharicrinis sp. FJH54 TaxID=3344665 RepID=UPI0035D4D2B7
MKTGSLIYIFLISFSFLFGNKDLKQADKAYKQQNYSKAVILYEKYKSEEEGQRVDPETSIRMANCYYFLNDFEKAKKNYELAGETNLKGEDRITYGKLLFLQGDYDKALTFFRTDSETDVPDHYTEQVNWMKNRTNDTSSYTVKKTDINTFGQSFGVQYYQGGIVFSSSSSNANVLDYHSNLNSEKEVDLKGLEFLNLYYSPVINNGELGRPVLFSENLKSDYHIGAVTFSPDYKTMYYTKVIKLPQEQTVLKIYKAEYKSGMWRQIGPLPFNNDNTYNCAHPALSITGDTLYFVSDKPGGKGGKDIYFSRRSGSYWLAPQNLTAVNSAGDELFPFVSSDNIFYFASNGYPGYGGLDVFKVDLKSKDKEITNMKYGINSRFDDFAYILNPENTKEGYLSSNRTTGGRYDNIYRIAFEEPKEIVEDTAKTEPVDTVPAVEENPFVDMDIQVSNALSGVPIADVLVALTDETDNSLLFEGTTDQLGKTGFKVEKALIDPTTDIHVSARAQGKFEPYERTLKGEDFINLNSAYTDINIIPIIEETQTITIPQNKLKFALNSYELSYDAKKILERWYEYLKSKPNIRLRLNAHTDSQGDLDYNLALSQKRADNAKAYLVQRGINPNRIVARGYGERYILNHCKDGVDCTDAEHEVNRRIEIIVIVD